MPKFVSESQALDLYDSPEHLIETMQNFMSSHADCHLDFDCDDYYGSKQHTFSIVGKRPATKEEIAAQRKEAAARKKEIDRRRQAELEEARRLLRAAGEL